MKFSYPDKYRIGTNSFYRWYNVIGIAIRYGLDVPRIESRWGRDCPCPSRLAPRPTQTLVKWAQALFRR